MSASQNNATAVPLAPVNLSVRYRLQPAASITVTLVGGWGNSALLQPHTDICIIFLKYHNPPLTKEGL